MKSNGEKVNIIGITFSLVILSFLLCSSPVKAVEKATLHNFKHSETLPSFKLDNIKTGKYETVIPGNGKPTLLLFFSIQPDFRKKRSLALISSLGNISEQYKNKVNMIAILSDTKGTDVVKDYVKTFASKIDVYKDSDKTIHNKYGVFMMPLVVMTNKDGELHEVIPYTFNIRELIDGNFKLLFGEWTKEQLLDSLKPKQMVPKSDEEKEYIRRLNYGRIMFSKKMYSQAIREFSTAIKLMPNSLDAMIELGFVYINNKDWDNAESTFNKALAIDSESDDGIAGLGLSFYGKGEIDQSKPILENALIAQTPRLEVIIALAEIYETAGNNVKANRLNKLAISRLMTLYEQRWK